MIASTEQLIEVVMIRNFCALVLGALLLTGCLFGRLEAKIEEGLEKIDDSRRATPEEVADILKYDWLPDNRPETNQIRLKDGVLTITTDGIISQDDFRGSEPDIKTKDVRSYDYQSLTEEGYARFKLIKGEICPLAGNTCVKDVSGAATVQFLKVKGENRIVGVAAQLNAVGDRQNIQGSRLIYSGIDEYIVIGWIYR